MICSMALKRGLKGIFFLVNIVRYTECSVKVNKVRTFHGLRVVRRGPWGADSTRGFLKK